MAGTPIFNGEQAITRLRETVHGKGANFYAMYSSILGEKACNWAFLSAMVALEKRAQQLGANAVINIVSYYNKRVMSSATEFECHAGAIIAGVALKGDSVKFADG